MDEVYIMDDGWNEQIKKAVEQSDEDEAETEKDCGDTDSVSLIQE